MMMLKLLLITSCLLTVSFGQDSSIIECKAVNQLCPENNCCNTLGFCGTTAGFCGSGNCSSQCPAAGTAQCGPKFGNAQCPDGTCCSVYSWCGVDSGYCGSGNCSAQCPLGTCGVNGGQCGAGSCCNINGFCGNTIGYCGVGNCQSQCPSSSGGTKNLGVKVGVPLVIIAFLIACSVIAFFVRKRYRERGRQGFSEFDDPIMFDGMPERFSYKELSVATRGFSQESKLGQGGFGSVHRGVLPSSGIPVAVKKINSDSNQGEKEFMAEVSIISRLRHRNLIQLQGWCKDVAREKYLLVYELMPNGSLDKVLFQGAASEGQTACLSWPQRLSIVKGTAAAVDYLHQGWKQQVIHRDIKASNIMLDEEWNAKLGDFGLARLVDHQRAATTTVVAGTCGYIAPEAAYSGRFTDKTDVFAFGAVVLEIACGRMALSTAFPPDQITLVDWVWERLSENALLTTVDKRLQGSYEKYWMEVVLVVGLWCSHPDPLARPAMRQVVEVLAGDVPVPSIPSSKPAPVYQSSPLNFWIQGPKSGRTSKSDRSGTLSLIPTDTEISDYPPGSTT